MVTDTICGEDGADENPKLTAGRSGARRTASVVIRAGLAQGLEFLIGELYLGCGHVLFQMSDLRRAWESAASPANA